MSSGKEHSVERNDDVYFYPIANFQVWVGRFILADEPIFG